MVMGKLFEYIAGTFTAPRTAFQQIAADRPLGGAVTVFILTSLISSLAGLAGIPADLPDGAALLLPAVVVGSLIFGAFAWCLQTGIYHLFAEFLGGRGQAFSLFTALPFTSLPGLLLAPIGVLLRNLAGLFLGVPVSLALALWVFFLQIVALRAVYNLSTARAAAAVLLPFVIFIAAIVIFAITAFTSLVPLVIHSLRDFPLAS